MAGHRRRDGVLARHAPWLCGVQLHALHAVRPLREHLLQADRQAGGRGSRRAGAERQWAGRQEAGARSRGTCGGLPGLPRGRLRAPSAIPPSLALMSRRSGCRGGQERSAGVGQGVKQVQAGVCVKNKPKLDMCAPWLPQLSADRAHGPKRAQQPPARCLPPFLRCWQRPGIAEASRIATLGPLVSGCCAMSSNAARGLLGASSPPRLYSHLPSSPPSCCPLQQSLPPPRQASAPPRRRSPSS